MSQNVLTCKFTINQLNADIITRGRSKEEASVVVKWDSNDILQSRVGAMAKSSSFFLLQSETSSITK